MSLVTAISRISLTTADAKGAAAFYEAAFGFERIAEEERDEAFAELMGLPGAKASAVVLRLGEQEIELVAFRPEGKPYPADSASNDLWFQHFAIVVADVAAAFGRLSGQKGWTPISVDGPEKLPASSGGVTAFKFRDPEGHPLELLSFPPETVPPQWQGRAGVCQGAGVCLGIDHSAIAVAATGSSAGFYQQLGFRVVGRSLNHGKAQERLDDADGAVVEVTALQCGSAAPHLELLHYQRPTGRPAPSWRSNDVAKTRLLLDAPDVQAVAAAVVKAGSGQIVSRPPDGNGALIRDPSGHDLVVQTGV